MFYPNFLRGIDHYLKINYPHVWRTRVHDFGWFSLVLGNVAAAVLGTLAVGYDEIFSWGELSEVCTFIRMILVFVVLFWVTRLVKFRANFSDIKTIITTWLIYIFCFVLLGLNLATFVSSVAFRTANLYPNKTALSDYNYLTEVIKIYGYDSKEEDAQKECQNTQYDKGEYLKMYHSEILKGIMSRHGRHYDGHNICQDDIDAVVSRLELIEQAENFLRVPIRTKHRRQFEASLYHDLLEVHWFFVVLVLFLLPSILFMLSSFGIKNMLVSAFFTILLFGLMNVIVESVGFNEEEFRILLGSAVVFILGGVLAMTMHYRQIWNYIAGVLMFTTVLLFYMFVYTVLQSCGVVYRTIIPLWVVIGILPIALFASLMVALIITKFNSLPGRR